MIHVTNTRSNAPHEYIIRKNVFSGFAEEEKEENNEAVLTKPNQHTILCICSNSIQTHAHHLTSDGLCRYLLLCQAGGGGGGGISGTRKGAAGQKMELPVSGPGVMGTVKVQSVWNLGGGGSGQ